MAYLYKTWKRGGKTVLVHRYKMEQKLGRKLRRNEHVHHRNGDRYDNRIANLEILSATAHAAHHKNKHPRVKICAWCGMEFEPSPTKRARAICCSWPCGREQSLRTRRALAPRRHRRAA